MPAKIVYFSITATQQKRANESFLPKFEKYHAKLP